MRFSVRQGLVRTRRNERLVVVLLIAAIAVVRGVEYCAAHFLGDRDGEITTPWLAVGLLLAQGLLLALLMGAIAGAVRR